MSERASLATVIGDGDATSLDDVLRALAIIEDEYARIRDARQALRKTAAAMMLAEKVKAPVVTVGRLTYVASVERYTDTVCACHKQRAYLCENRRYGPILLIEQPEPPIAKLKAVLPANQRYDGDAAAA